MIQLASISKAYGGDQLFESLEWRLPDQGLVGLVGANGAGKSTLFRIIAGLEEPDGGRVVVPRDARVGYLPQEMTEVYEGTVLEVISEGAAELLDLQDRLSEIEGQLEVTDESTSEELTDKYGELQEQFRRRGGYSLTGRARQIAAGLGFAEEDFARPIEEFSGGWRMRALVGQLLLAQPDVLLLDEPTNHLDLEALEWLEGYLREYDGTIVVISHDRYFLNRLADQIAELAHRDVRVYEGGYDDFIEQREKLREQLEAKRAEQEKERAKIQEFINKFRYNASKAAQVQSRIKMLEKMEPIEVPPDPTPDINFSFPQPPRVGKRVVDVEELKKAYGDNVVFDSLDFRVYRGDKVALVGPNGAGKSTLLKLLAGRLEPDEGELTLGHRVETAYFAQHSVDELDLGRTVLEEMQAHASSEAFPRIRTVLGAFKFGDDDVDKPIEVLSGGEKSRLALAKMLLEPAGLLLLDEPTNHLDIASRQMLEKALAEFEGAFCVVSHDRYFLNEIVDKVAHIERGEVTVYEGDYDYYNWKHARTSDAPDSAAQAEEGGQESTEPTYTKKEIRRRTARLRRERDERTAEVRDELAELEEQIERAESRHAELEAELARPETYEDSERMAELNREFKRVEQKLETLMGRWEKVAESLDEIERRFARRQQELKDALG
ncbi:MAG: ATP-binding cassette domain-containing protein [Persicimonas sp.]